MPLRDKLKKTFTKKSSPTNSTSTSPPLRKDIEYYKPHEIPKSKYRGRVDPAHQQSLEAYSLGDAFQTSGRRASQALSGTFSPGGTNALSAAPSAAHSRRSSWISTGRTKSSLGSTDTGASDDAREDGGKANEGNDVDGNDLYLSRTITAADPDRPSNQNIPELRVEKTITLGPGPSSSPPNNPFSAEDLEKAMTAATLRPRRGTVVAMGVLQPEGVAVAA